MKNTCWKLFSYLTIDHRAAQDFLNEMAADGWELEVLVLNLFARFKRTQRTDLSYYLDWADPKRTEDPDYIRMCAESGWYIKEELRYWNLYESRPGFSPVPIQTDAELEYQRFRKKTLRRMALNIGITVLCLAPILPVYLAFGINLEEYVLNILSKNIFGSVLLLILPFWLMGTLAHLVLLGQRMLEWRRALPMGEAPIPSRRRAEVWKGISVLGWFSLLFVPFLSGVELLFNGFTTTNQSCISFSLLVISLMFISFDRNRRKKSQVRVFLCVSCAVVLCGFLLHFPFSAVFPGRFPTAPLTETEVVGKVLFQTDAPLGSSKDWLEEDGDHRYWFTARTWALPALAEWDAERSSEGMYPVQGQQGIWLKEQGVALFYRGNTVIQVICGEDKLSDPGFSDMVWAWIDKIK